MWKRILNCRIYTSIIFMKYRTLTLEWYLVRGIALNKYSNFLHSINTNTIMKRERGRWLVSAVLEDDPKLVHSMQVAKMQSDRVQENYEKTKTSYHTLLTCSVSRPPRDAQANITNTNYKHLDSQVFPPWCHEHPAVQEHENRLQSDVSDLSGWWWHS